MKYVAVLTLALLGIMMSRSNAQEKPNTERNSDTQTDAKQLLGTYKITSGERNGKKVDAEHLKDVTV